MNKVTGSSKKGFTLIELLVVVAVLALLASIVFSNLGGAREGAKISNALSFESQTHSLLGSDLVGWWKFDDDLNDTSGYGNNGTWGGAGSPTYVDGVPGKGGKAIEFDGTTDYVNSQLNGFVGGDMAHTICFWFWLDSLPSSRKDPLTLGNASDSNYSSVDVYSDRIQWYFYNNDIHVNVVPQVEEWTNLCLAYRGGGGTIANKDIYLDGGKQTNLGTSGSSYGNSLNLPNNPLVGIGRDRGRNTAYFPGKIDDVRIYSRALTAQEIKGLYAQNNYKYVTKE